MPCSAIAGASPGVSCRASVRSAGILMRRGGGLVDWGDWASGLEGIARNAGDFVLQVGNAELLPAARWYCLEGLCCSKSNHLDS